MKPSPSPLGITGVLLMTAYIIGLAKGFILPFGGIPDIDTYTAFWIHIVVRFCIGIWVGWIAGNKGLDFELWVGCGIFFPLLSMIVIGFIREPYYSPKTLSPTENTPSKTKIFLKYLSYFSFAETCRKPHVVLFWLVIMTFYRLLPIATFIIMMMLIWWTVKVGTIEGTWGIDKLFGK